MKCPECKKQRTAVVDSRPCYGGESIRRSRHCTVCNFRFTTYEIWRPDFVADYQI